VGWSLAAVAVAMVFISVIAVFVPSSATLKPKTLTVFRTPLGALIHPLFAGHPSASGPASADPSSDPPSPTAPASPLAPVVYPAPVYPAPVYPTPHYPTPARTYPAPSPDPSPSGSDLPPVKPLIQPVLGVVSDDPANWAAATHANPVLATRYVSMATPLPPSWLHSAMRVADGATPVIELTLASANGSAGITLASVANGSSDNWLTDLRAEIDQLGRPVVIAFGPEANGDWYSWGSTPNPGTSPAPNNASAYIAAYKHVHDKLGTSLITWLWQVSAHNPRDPSTADFNSYWPGAPFVNWFGFDGYYYKPGDSFKLRFQFSLSEIRSWWSGPTIVAETAISPLTRNMPDDVTDLFKGVVANNLMGLIYLDLNVCQGQCSTYKQDFRIEQYPPALAVFIKEASQW
jgi:hypothetical protein